MIDKHKQTQSQSRPTNIYSFESMSRGEEEAHERMKAPSSKPKADEIHASTKTRTEIRTTVIAAFTATTSNHGTTGKTLCSLQSQSALA